MSYAYYDNAEIRDLARESAAAYNAEHRAAQRYMPAMTPCHEHVWRRGSGGLVCITAGCGETVSRGEIGD